MRAFCGGLVLLLVSGCASNGTMSSRTVPKVILGALVLGSAAVAIGAAVKGDAIETKLANDYKQRDIPGPEFASRDSDGRRWNRIGRAATFIGGLSLLGLGVIWEMSLGDRAESRASQPANPAPIFPVPSAALPLPGALGPSRPLLGQAR
jgi:hypothetical protein